VYFVYEFHYKLNKKYDDDDDDDDDGQFTDRAWRGSW